MRDRCGCCGGTRLVDAVDNFGRQYRGCASCRILSLAEIEAIVAQGSDRREAEQPKTTVTA